MQTKPEEVELVKQNLALVAHIESAREAADLLGVSPQKVIDWRNDKIRPLRDPTPSKLSSNLRNGLGGRNGRKQAERPPGVDRGSGLEREWLAAYREIRASDATPEQKMLDVDALSSFVAHIAWERAERAGERRAAAIEAMHSAGKLRAGRAKRGVVRPEPRPRPDKEQENGEEDAA